MHPRRPVSSFIPTSNGMEYGPERVNLVVSAQIEVQIGLVGSLSPVYYWYRLISVAVLVELTSAAEHFSVVTASY